MNLKTLVALSVIHLVSAAALASPGRICAETNAWANFPDLPNVVCTTRPSDFGEAPVEVSLYRAGHLLDRLAPQATLHPGGVHCNHHTGDCNSYPPYRVIAVQDAAFALDLHFDDFLSGTIRNIPHDFTQDVYGVADEPNE